MATLVIVAVGDDHASRADYFPIEINTTGSSQSRPSVHGVIYPRNLRPPDLSARHWRL